VGIGILVALGLPGLAAGQALLPMRQWVSNEGKKIEAELLGFDATQAQLRMPNGQRVMVPDERFSPVDQAELVRARLRHECWSTTKAATRTDYFYSLKTPENRRNDLITGYVSFGPEQFTFGLMIPTRSLNLRTYDRITYDDGDGATYEHDYTPEAVVRWGEASRETTRVTTVLNATYGMSLVPILRKGLVSGRLAITASRAGMEPAVIKISPEEQKALLDILNLFARAQVLVKSGVMKRAPLGEQVFQTEPSAAVAAAPSPAEDTALQRFRASRGGGRFGKITWKPASSGTAVSVDGLGWIRADVVVRTAEGEVQRVPFAEIDSDNQKKIFRQRLSDFAGSKPTSRGDYDFYYSKERQASLHAYAKGLIFAQQKATGKPFLYVQGNSTRLRGAPVTQLILRGDGINQALNIPVDGKETKRHTEGKTVWSIAGAWLNSGQRDIATGLAKSQAIQLEIKSAEDISSQTLEDEHLQSTLEAVCCYLWALIIQ
jgi:hypothetical protein